MDAVVDRFVVGRKHEKAIKAGIAATLLVGDGLLQVHVVQGRDQGARPSASTRRCAARRITSSTATSGPSYFMFNNPESACRTCGGLGVDKLTHPELLVPDPQRSIRGGCFVREAFRYNPDTWDGRMMFSLAKALALLARHAVEGAAGDGAQARSSTASSQKLVDHDAAGREGQDATTRKARRSASAASRGASSATTAATGSAAKPTPAWKRGSTR